jgi:hypothetical protein
MDSNVTIPAFLSVMGFGLVIVAGMFTAMPSTVPMSSSSSPPTKETPKQQQTVTERYHVSKKKLGKLVITDPNTKFTLKPTGLWYAFTKTRWIEWGSSVVDDMFKKNDIVYLYRLQFSKPPNIYIVDSLKKAKDLCKQITSGHDMTPRYNWNKIKQQGYDGVEIYEDVLDAIFGEDGDSCLLMLQSFDISSGCLWNVENVKVELIETIKIK